MFTETFSKTASILKMRFGTVDIGSLDPHKPNEAWTAKIDGAHSVVDFKKGKVPEVYSYRKSKRTGGAIPYNAKLPHIQTAGKLNARFRAEVYAVDKEGRAVHPGVVTSILNSSPDKSLKLQKELGLQTRTALIEVETINNKPATHLPFSEKRKLMEAVCRQYPEFTLPDMAVTPTEKTKLLAEIKSGEHEQTKEGVITHNLTEPHKRFGKAKIWHEHDVYVTGIFPEAGKRTPMAGGFTYAWSPKGEVKGRVGTGFDHAMKEDMLKHPEKYIGRVARVSAAEVSKNKILVKPAFQNWHVEKNINGFSKSAAYEKQTVIVDKSLAEDKEEAKAIASRFADRLYTSRETKSSFRFRQRNPKLFVPGSFRTAKIKPGISIIYGQVKEKKKGKK